MPSHPAITSRKAPKQQRSRATVDAILVATAEVLEEHGFEKTTTNMIARRAGVSVGSLYQYFPNKDALVGALAEQHIEEVKSRVMSQLEACRTVPLPQALHLIIGGLVAHHARDANVHQVFLDHGPRIVGTDYCREVDRLMEQAIIAHLAQRPERLRPRNLELGVFMLVHGVEAITHAALFDRPDELENGELARELVDLVARYLLDDAKPTGPGCTDSRC